MTPLKVRGKRHGANAGQWHAGKKRPQPSSTPASREGTPASQHSVVPARKRRRHNPTLKLSRLEELPSEVLQTIFEYSANLDLPAASPSLRTQLSSRHMFRRLTDRILLPFVECGAPCNEPDFPFSLTANYEERVPGAGCDTTVARRLLNSKFFTWDFFQAWSADIEKIHAEELELDLCEGAHVRQVLGLFMTPPNKVFIGPWDADDGYKKLYFLTIADVNDRFCPQRFEETCCAAVRSAIALDNTRAATAFMRYMRTCDMDVDMDDTLRYAVLDYGCNKQIVLEILSTRKREPNLDPELWTWAEKKRKSGEEVGAWLLRMLKSPTAVYKEQRYRTDIHKFTYRWTPTPLDEAEENGVEGGEGAEDA